MSGDSTNGTPITRRELALELRASRAEDREETTKVIKDALRPVLRRFEEHDRGEFGPGFTAGILKVVAEDRTHGWLLRSNKAAVTSVLILMGGTAVNMILNLKIF